MPLLLFAQISCSTIPNPVGIPPEVRISETEFHEFRVSNTVQLGGVCEWGGRSTENTLVIGNIIALDFYDYRNQFNDVIKADVLNNKSFTSKSRSQIRRTIRQFELESIISTDNVELFLVESGGLSYEYFSDLTVLHRMLNPAGFRDSLREIIVDRFNNLESACQISICVGLLKAEELLIQFQIRGQLPKIEQLNLWSSNWAAERGIPLENVIVEVDPTEEIFSIRIQQDNSVMRMYRDLSLTKDGDISIGGSFKR